MKYQFEFRLIPARIFVPLADIRDYAVIALKVKPSGELCAKSHNSDRLVPARIVPQSQKDCATMTDHNRAWSPSIPASAAKIGWAGDHLPGAMSR